MGHCFEVGHRLKRTGRSSVYRNGTLGNCVKGGRRLTRTGLSSV
jgi:hypothetical protein